MKNKFLNKVLSRLYPNSAEESNPSTVYQSYKKSRLIDNQSALCHAPLNSMYFNVYGQVAPCWLTLDDEDVFPKKTLQEIWRGNKFEALREELSKDYFPEKCKVCMQNVLSGNHISVLSKLYDNSHELSDYPSLMEFELSNTCNLACVMCKGELSSTIRRIRDGLPPLESPYDEQFIEQLKEFIPHLKEAKFLGGEPFLIDIYYDIWEKMIELNPNIEITITTNATAYNHKIASILDSLKCNIIISMDSFNKVSYESIRLRANFERVLENFLKFRDYTKSKGTYFGVSINPLRKNWKELAAYVDQCNEHGASLWFNTVVYPFKEALWTLSAIELEEIYDELCSKPPQAIKAHWDKNLYNNNLQKWNNLVDVQIKHWLSEAKDRAREKEQLLSEMSSTEQLAEALLMNLESHVYEDAYIGHLVKEKTIERIKTQVAALRNQERMDELSALFVLPESESLEKLNGSI